MSLFFEHDVVNFDVPDATISYFPNIFCVEESKVLFEKLLSEIPWIQEDIVVYGKKYAQPRLTCLFGDNDRPYKYSNITMYPNQWTPLLLTIKNRVEQYCKYQFTTALINQYRDGKDSNGWHADNEKELGQNPIIASVSFGAERVFQLKHNTIKNQKLNLTLENGSLLLMEGTTQHFWKHQIPKTAKPVGVRINLTFRIVY
jgi:alkylated DNA repair dioxygenase AlkB